MSLLDTLKADFLASRKAKHAITSSVLSTLIGDLETSSKKTGKPIEDSQIVALVKNRMETDRDTLKVVRGVETPSAKKMTIELETGLLVYEKYMPVQLAKFEIERLISMLIDDVADLNVGKVQAFFKNHYSGQYDAKLVTETFKAITTKVEQN